MDDPKETAITIDGADWRSASPEELIVDPDLLAKGTHRTRRLGALSNWLLAPQPERPIRAVFGPEPLREGEIPTAYIVGQVVSGTIGAVTRIDPREWDLGSSAVVWFDVWVGDTLVASLNASYVAEVQFSNAA